VLVPVASSAGVLRLNDSQRKVRDAVRAGAGTPKEIEFHSRLSKSTVTRTLKALMKMDVVAHDGSRYTIADTE
jgi:DNA-binding IclR family transcriptional regulator